MLPLANKKTKRHKGKAGGIEAVVEMEPARPQPSDQWSEEEAFGWQLFHDRQRNLVYYLHSYTGEVRWPRPETVGFVMHGLRPLPTRSGADAAMDPSSGNPDIWSPYYPHVVMMPSGLMQVHPRSGSETRASEIWCGYNRFPLAHFGTCPSNETFPSAVENDVLLRNRILPPTWEESRNGSPFLPPYPVTILGQESLGDKPMPPPPLTLPERFQTPEIKVPRSYQQYKSGELKLVQGTMSWPALSHGNATPTSPPRSAPTASTRKLPEYSKGIVAPRSEKKEHNRKGYLLRQARKMMRENTNSSAAAVPKQLLKASTPRLEFSRELENKRETPNDHDPLSSLEC